MSTLALDGLGDLALDTSKRLTVITGGAEVATRIRSRFKLVRGEWYLDTEQGTPWFGAVLGVKSPDLRIVRQILTDVITNTPGVASLDELTVTLDRAARQLNVTFSATAADGSTITATDLDQPYIVTAA